MPRQNYMPNCHSECTFLHIIHVLMKQVYWYVQVQHCLLNQNLPVHCEVIIHRMVCKFHIIDDDLVLVPCTPTSLCGAETWKINFIITTTVKTLNHHIMELFSCLSEYVQVKILLWEFNERIFLVHCIFFLFQGKYEEALQVVEGPLGEKLISYVFIPLKRASLLMKLERWRETNILYKLLLREE